MPQHCFILQHYKTPSSRYHCPQCNHRRRTLTRYIDTQTGQEVADHVGICDRTEKCGYHYPPRQYFAENAADNLFTKPIRTQPRPPIRKPFDTLPISMVKQSTCDSKYYHNHFVFFLAKRFGWDKTVEAAQKYQVGTAKHWYGACVFWQIDKQQRVRTGKIMLYDRLTCKRVKEPFNHIAWAHGVAGGRMSEVGCQKLPDESSQNKSDFLHQTSDFNLQQCLFGEHLLNHNPEATVFITESEKTAVIASILLPQFIWLAAGARNGLSVEKCQPLAGRKVYLVPDVGCYQEWREKARELNLRIPTATFIIHDELERDATDDERQQGIDWADRWLGAKKTNITNT